MSISDKEAIKEAGVRRLNKKPLAIVGLAFIIIVAILAHSISQRGKDQKASEKRPESEGPAPVIDSKSSYLNLVKDAPFGLIADTTDTKPEIDEFGENGASSTSSTPAPHTEAKSPGHESSTTLAIVPEHSLHPKRKEETDELEERSRRASLKRQLYEQALSAPTTVNLNKLDNSKEGQGSLPSLADLLKGSSAAGGAADAIGGRLSTLAALAGAAGGGGDTNNQKSKQDFVDKDVSGRFGYLQGARTTPLSPYELKAGTVIPAILVTSVNSDLPGMLIGQVSQNVYDTATGNYLLIPQGSKIIGSYDSMVSYGQSRALVAWNKLSFPDASTLSLGTMPGADQAGAAGFTDQTNNHYVKLFTSAMMLSLFSAGVQFSQPSSNATVPTARETIAAEIGRELGQLGQELIRKQMNVQPTIEIRSGYRFNIMVNKDISLAPYAPLRARLSSNP